MVKKRPMFLIYLTIIYLIVNLFITFHITSTTLFPSSIPLTRYYIWTMDPLNHWIIGSCYRGFINMLYHSFSSFSQTPDAFSDTSALATSSNRWDEPLSIQWRRLLCVFVADFTNIPCSRLGDCCRGEL